MTFLLISLIALALFALIAGLVRVWWYKRRGEQVPDIQKARPEGCCGQHEVCEKVEKLAYKINQQRVCSQP